MAARLDAPVFGAFLSGEGEEAQTTQRWQVSFGWRYQKSDRHFVGTDEQEERQEEGSEVINHLNIGDLGVRYSFDPRTSLSVSVPFLLATRSSALRAPNREIVGRTEVQANGLSDMTVVARRLMIDPAKRPKGNVSVGAGIKIPTGKEDVTDTRVRMIDGQLVSSIETVDQSIQPGDGGWGFIVDLSAYRQLGVAGQVALYAGGTYLFNPETTNGTPTFRARPSEAIMSIADQYVVRAGVQAAPLTWNGIGVGLGVRWEGVPPHDVFGSSDGFRRPGYGISAEPTVAWSKGKRAFSLAVPIALERNRQRSVSDHLVGGHGDAAFADWLVIASYWYRF